MAYADNNGAFLDALACGRSAALKPGAPCAFVVDAGDGVALMAALAARGFELYMLSSSDSSSSSGSGSGCSSSSSGMSLVPACVPPRGLRLPPSKKALAQRQRSASEAAA